MSDENGLLKMQMDRDSGSEHVVAGVQPAQMRDSDRIVRVNIENSQFSPDLILLQKGETVAFKIVNKTALLHEFSVGNPALQLRHRGRISLLRELGALRSDRIDFDRMEIDGGYLDEISPHLGYSSVFIEPNKIGWIVLRFLDADGLNIACNLPKHTETGSFGMTSTN